MSKLKSKSDVIEWYWIDFLNYVQGKKEYAQKYNIASHVPQPTIAEFWKWYIGDGPLGVKKAGRWYTKTEVEYV